MTVGIQGLTAQPLAKALGLLASDDPLLMREGKSQAASDPVSVVPDSS